MSFTTALNSVSVLFLLLIIGFACGKAGIVNKEGQIGINKLTIYVLLPATIIKSMMGKADSNAFSKILTMLIITAIAYVFISATAYLFGKQFKLPEHQKGVLRAGMSFSNISFMGFPVLTSLFGDKIIFYAVLSQGIIFELYAWSVGIYFLTKHRKDAHNSFSIKEILIKPTIIASFVGVFLTITQIQVPHIIQEPISILSRATSPMAMLTVGLMLSESNVKHALKNKYLYISSLVKLIIVPFVLAGVLYLIGIKGECMAVPVIELGMPTAAYLAMLSGIAKNDTALASELVFVSSFLSLFTIPILVYALNFIM